MADEFTRWRLEWLELVQDDPAHSPACLAVAFAISRHLNRRTGDAWPAQSTLSRKVGLKVRQLRKLIGQLERGGYLEIRSGGFQRPDRYRMTLPDRHSSAALIPAPDCRTSDTPDRHSSASQTGIPVPPNPLIEPSEVFLEGSPTPPIPNPQPGEEAHRGEPQEAIGVIRDPQLADAFRAFWTAWPGTQGEYAAQKLFEATIRAGVANADFLIDGAKRLAASDRVRRGYIPSPRTWFNERRWLDPDDATQKPTAAGGRPKFDPLQWAVEGVK